MLSVSIRTLSDAACLHAPAPLGHPVTFEPPIVGDEAPLAPGGGPCGRARGPQVIEPERQQVHGVQQLRFHKMEYGGFYRAPPKSGSVGDVDLDDTVAAAIAEHVDHFPPVRVDLPDITRRTPDPGSRPTGASPNSCSPMATFAPSTTRRGRSSGQSGAKPLAARRKAPSTRCGTTSPPH
jgi:hypothetical protein